MSPLCLLLIIIILFILALLQFPLFIPVLCSVRSSTRLERLGWSLIILSVLITCLILMACIFFSSIFPNSTMATLCVGLLVILLFAFSTNVLILFYAFFEISLIPIFWIIIGWGNQPERVSAGFNLLLYTACASLPLLVFILFRREMGISTFSQTNMIINNTIAEFSGIISAILLAAFLVKFPIFIVHLWLPKAHVEAPVVGSIILAGLLLKLGGFGICKLLHLVPRQTGLVQIIQILRLLGGAVIGVLCLRQKDVKVLIAYSSVRHMSIIISALLLSREWGVIGGILLILAHGVVSSGIFMAARIPYSRVHSRNMFLIKRNLTIMPIFSIF